MDAEIEAVEQRARQPPPVPGSLHVGTPALVVGDGASRSLGFLRVAMLSVWCKGLPGVTVVVLLLVTSCSSGSVSHPSAHPPAKPSGQSASTTVAFPTTTTVFVARPGKRVFSIQNVALAAGESLTIALHPTEVPIGVAVSATMPLDACPADLDGGVVPVGSHSWPSGSGFMTCLPLDASGRIALPSTNSRSYHVAFALRARASGTVRSVVINYSYEDAFLEVVPPPGRADGMTVSFTPLSSTVGVDANLLPN